MYEIFEHTADVGLRIRAADLDTLFADAGRGLFAIIVGDLRSVETRETRRIEVEGIERDYLLFDWLNELLYSFESRRLLLADFHVRVSETGLEAEVGGELLDPARHRLEHEVKAITYHGLRVEREGAGWIGEVILDI